MIKASWVTDPVFWKIQMLSPNQLRLVPTSDTS